MSSVTLELVLNGKRQLQELDVLAFVKKPIEHFVYKPIVKDTRIPLTYVQTKKLFSNHNVLINDHSSSISTNRKNYDFLYNKYYEITGPSLTTAYSSIKITNRSKVNMYGREVPLFFKHKAEGMSNASIEIVTNMDASLDRVYDIDYSAGAVFHNYKNFFNEDSGEYRLYFLNYLDSNENSTRELLDSDDVVYELSWKDIDPFTGLVKAGLEGYEKTSNAVDFTYYFNVPGLHWWAPTSDNNINLFVQKGRSSKEAWYLAITNGVISKTISNVLYQYKVNEYYQQNFAPRFPLLYTVFFELDYVNSSTLKSDTNSIFYSKDESLHVDVMVYNETNDLIRVLTTDQVKGGKRYENSDLFWEEKVIGSVDEKEGFISLSEDFSPQFTYKGSFFYEKKDFEFTKINLNPNYNKHVKDKYYVVYCIPNLYYYETSIHYLIVDKSGTIEYCSQGDGRKYERANYPCLSIRDEDGKYNPKTIVGSYYKNSHDGTPDSFIELYSSLGENEFNYMVLGEASFTESTYFDEIIHFEVSKLGDRIKDSKKEEVYRKNYKLLQSKYGYGENGHKYTLQNSSLVELPLSLVDKYGGAFTETQLRNIVKNKMPAQCFFHIDWVFPKSSGSLSTLKEGVVDIDLTYPGPNCSFAIYRKKSFDAKYEQIVAFKCNSVHTNQYSDTDVESGNTYWYKICIEKDGAEYPSINEIEVYVR